jgi:hypothetical protein
VSQRIHGFDVAVSIGGVVMRGAVSFEGFDSHQPEGLRRSNAYDEYAVTLSRTGFDLSKLLAMLHHPRPKKYTVFYVSNGTAHNCGTITAWTHHGVRRRLRRMLRAGPGDVASLFAFDWSTAAREERHPDGSITLTADCITVARPQMATAWARRTACEVSL